MEAMPKLLVGHGAVAEGAGAGDTAVADAPGRVAGVADRLADLTVSRWRRVAAERRITPAPIPVQWQRPCSQGRLPGSGLVTELHDGVYVPQGGGRLVVLGGAGAGKTSAMILLLLAVLDGRA